MAATGHPYHPMSSKHQRLILLAILALAVPLRLGVALYLGDRVEVLPGIHDQLSYDHLAQQILAGKGYQFDTNWYPFAPAGASPTHPPPTGQMPAHSDQEQTHGD